VCGPRRELPWYGEDWLAMLSVLAPWTKIPTATAADVSLRRPARKSGLAGEGSTPAATR